MNKLDTNKADGVQVKFIYQNGLEWGNGLIVYQILKIKSRYNDWIKKCIKKYGFICGTDYEIHLIPSTRCIFHKRKDYYLSPDMEERLIELERNDNAANAGGAK